MLRSKLCQSDMTQIRNQISADITRITFHCPRRGISYSILFKPLVEECPNIRCRVKTSPPFIRNLVAKVWRQRWAWSSWTSDFLPTAIGFSLTDFPELSLHQWVPPFTLPFLSLMIDIKREKIAHHDSFYPEVHCPTMFAQPLSNSAFLVCWTFSAGTSSADGKQIISVPGWSFHDWK